jgi:hypothetical protein
MSRRIEQDGKFFRMRRGRLVQIPPEWVGIIPSRCCWYRANKTFWVRHQNRQERQTAKKALFQELMSL